MKIKLDKNSEKETEIEEIKLSDGTIIHKITDETGICMELPRSKITFVSKEAETIYDLSLENDALQQRIAYLKRSIERKEEEICSMEQERVPYTNVYVKKLEEKSKLLKAEINKISKKEMTIMNMLQSIENCPLTKQRIDEIEIVMFELGSENNE